MTLSSKDVRLTGAGLAGAAAVLSRPLGASCRACPRGPGPVTTSRLLPGAEGPSDQDAASMTAPTTTLPPDSPRSLRPRGPTASPSDVPTASPPGPAPSALTVGPQDGTTHVAASGAPTSARAQTHAPPRALHALARPSSQPPAPRFTDKKPKARSSVPTPPRPQSGGRQGWESDPHDLAPESP